MIRVMRHCVFAFSSVLWLGCSSDQAPLTTGELALAESGTDLQGSGACAALAQIDQDCPADLAWDNHGQYVSCVAKYSSARVAAGDLSEEQRQALITAAAQSDIGKPEHAAHVQTKSHPDAGADDDGDGDKGAAGAAANDDADDADDAGDAGDAGDADAGADDAAGGSAGARGDDHEDDGDDGDDDDDSDDQEDKPDWSDAAGETCP